MDLMIIVILLFIIVFAFLVIYLLRKMGITNSKKKIEESSTPEDGPEPQLKEDPTVSKKNKENQKMENIIETPNDYPVMAFLGKLFNYIAIFNAITGVVISVIFLINFNFIAMLLGLLGGVLGWALNKFLSESMKIFSDIANNVKVIRHNSGSWSK